MKIADAADARGPGHYLLDVPQQLAQQAAVLGIALNKTVGGMAQRRLPQGPVLGEVIQADYFMSGLEQVFNQVAANESCRTRNQDFHERRAPPGALERFPVGLRPSLSPTRQRGRLPASLARR